MNNFITYEIAAADQIRILPCVYKIGVGKRFFIWKGKDLDQSIQYMLKDLSRKIKKDCPPTDLLFKIATYMRRFRSYHLVISVLFESDDPNELIKFEKKALLESKDNELNLNNSLNPYVPAWMKQTENKPVTAGQIKKPVTVQTNPIEINQSDIKREKRQINPINQINSEAEDLEIGIEDIRSLFNND